MSETTEHETDIVAPPLNSPTPHTGLEELTVLLRQLFQQEAPEGAATGRSCADALPVMNPSRDLERVEVQRDANVRRGHVLSAASQPLTTSVSRDMVDETTPTSWPRSCPA